MNTQDDIKQIIDFFRIAIKMKETYRFTPKGDGYESDAEHTWSVAMLCMLLTKRIQKELNVDLDIEKILKMAILHDLAEVLTGDLKTWDSKGRIGKEEREERAIEELFSKLPKDLYDEFFSLWKECEAKTSLEAKIVKSLDRLEPVLHRIYLDYGWENLGENDPDKTVEALDSRHLARHEFSAVITELYQYAKEESIEREMLS